MKTFSVKYLRDGKEVTKYILLDKEPEKGSSLQTTMGVQVYHPDTKYGGIYGGSKCLYGLFIPLDADVEEISMKDFADILIESLRRNYVRKKELEDLTNNLLRY